jgi:nitroreductase
MSETIKNPVMDAILSRRSTRDFKRDVQLTETELNTILEAGIWAPTARNTQHIHFIVIQKPEVIAKIAERFSKNDFNDGKIRDFVYGAPTFIMLTGKKDWKYTHIDAGIVVENMSLAAQSLGLGSLIIGCVKDYFNTEDGRKYAVELGMPEDHVFSIGIALGHIATPTPPKPRVGDRITYIR